MASWDSVDTERPITSVGSDLPALPQHYLSRPRLHRRLSQSVDQAAVTVLLGPPVSGKTVLVSGWKRDPTRATQPMAYMALDVYDDDFPRFCSKLVSVLQQAHPGCGRTALTELASSRSARRFLDSLLAELSELDRTVLVLDGVDVLDRGSVTSMLGDLLVELPSSLRVVIASRTVPPIREGLLRARGELVEIRGRELAFDVSELEEFLAGFDGLDLGPNEVLDLYERTEGWAGGVKLAALTLAQHHDPAAFVGSFTGRNRYVADLLGREVLEPQPPEVRDFLLATSVLSSFDETLANLVTKSSSTGELLERVERSGMFLEPIDDERSRFRYSPLFREFLQAELHRLDPAREREAHRTVAPEHESRGDVSAAVCHYLDGGALGDAVRLILEHGVRYAATGRVDTLRRWLAAMPDEALTDDLDRMLKMCRLCLLVGMREEMVMWLQRAKWRIAELNDDQLVARHALLTGFAHLQIGNLEAAVSEGHRGLAIVEAARPGRRLHRSAVQLLVAACAGLDEFDAARRHLEAAPFDRDEEIASDFYRSWLHYREGGLERAMGYASHLLNVSDQPWQRAYALLTRGAVHRERNRLSDADRDLTKTLELAHQWSRPMLVVLSSLELALLRVAQGRAAEAFEVLAAGRVHVHGAYLGQRLDVLEASLWLRDGDLDRCRTMRRSLPDGRPTALLDVRLALASDQIKEAQRLLEDYEPTARSLQERISTCLLKARTKLPSDEGTAADELHWAIALGRRERFVQVFAWDLGELEHLIRRLTADTDDLYLFNLLAAIAEPVPDPPAWTALAEPLSTREQIVLRYLPTTLSNHDIAEELHMSVNTLKTHLKSIYRKLGASSRLEAVAIARQLRLL